MTIKIYLQAEGKCPRSRYKRWRLTFRPSAFNRPSAIASRFIIQLNSQGDFHAAFPANKLFQVSEPHREKSDLLRERKCFHVLSSPQGGKVIFHHPHIKYSKYLIVHQPHARSGVWGTARWSCQYFPCPHHYQQLCSRCSQPGWLQQMNTSVKLHEHQAAEPSCRHGCRRFPAHLRRPQGEEQPLKGRGGPRVWDNGTGRRPGPQRRSTGTQTGRNECTDLNAKLVWQPFKLEDFYTSAL